MKKNKIGSILVAVVIIGIMIGSVLLYFVGFAIVPEIPLGIKIIAALICAAIIYGILHILIERIREIQKGEIEGRKVQTIGLVKGSTIQTVNAIRDFGAGLKTLVGGELVKYNEMMNNARALATKRMVDEAESVGADAIVAVRYASASVMQNAAEVMAYGTAVKFVD